MQLRLHWQHQWQHHWFQPCLQTVRLQAAFWILHLDLHEYIVLFQVAQKVWLDEPLDGLMFLG